MGINEKEQKEKPKQKSWGIDFERLRKALEPKLRKNQQMENEAIEAAKHFWVV